jgi:hypothetical protein
MCHTTPAISVREQLRRVIEAQRRTPRVRTLLQLRGEILLVGRTDALEEVDIVGGVEGLDLVRGRPVRLLQTTTRASVVKEEPSRAAQARARTKMSILRYRS